MKIDAHQHFWNFNAVRDSWITDDMRILRQNFLLPEAKQQLHATGFDGCVAVQADHSEMENDFLLSLAADDDIVKGVVGWVDFCSDDVEERLSYYSHHAKMKGFRHILQGEKDRAFMLQPAFMQGIAKLAAFNFTYDILIYPDQLSFVPQFVSAHPTQKFVLDHLAKPNIKAGMFSDWKKGMENVAKHPNVYCKVSGMVTEADWQHWQPHDLQPYLDAVWEAFGAERVMFGSDYPVCLLAGSYAKWVDVMEKYTATLTPNEQALFWHKNATAFYRLA